MSPFSSIFSWMFARNKTNPGKRTRLRAWGGCQGDPAGYRRGICNKHEGCFKKHSYLSLFFFFFFFFTLFDRLAQFGDSHEHSFAAQCNLPAASPAMLVRVSRLFRPELLCIPTVRYPKRSTDASWPAGRAAGANCGVRPPPNRPPT